MNLKSKKGFTLVEVIVVLVVMTLLLSGMLSIFDMGIKFYSKDRTQVANQESLRTVMTSIEKKIRKADHPNTPFAVEGGCLVIRSNANATGDAYCLSGDSITLNANPILDRVASFSIPGVVVNGSSISISITITSIPDSMGQVNTLTETFSARRQGEK